MKNFKLSVFILSTLLSTGMSAQNAPQLRADNIDEVINAMTTEEKAQMLVGGGNKANCLKRELLNDQNKRSQGNRLPWLRLF